MRKEGMVIDRYTNTPFSREGAEFLRVGGYVYLTGIIYSARDAAHKRMQETLDRGEELSFDLKDNVIYYLGPTPTREGRSTDSTGPTTSGQIDKYTPALLDLGLRRMMGKGKRSPEVTEAITGNKSVYFVAVGGAGAVLPERILPSEVIVYDDLGTEAIHKIQVKDFLVIMMTGTEGDSLYGAAILECQK